MAIDERRIESIVADVLERLERGTPAATPGTTPVLGVHPDYRGRRVASALVDQLRTNLLGLGIPTLQTEVRWTNPELITFFQHEGFRLAPRLCLDLDLAGTRI